jgi:methylmalonyl-CoA mutase cobalamin-binding subunit
MTWRVVLERAQRYELDARLLEARSRLGRWCDVADEVAAGLHELGLAWERGELTIAEEHVASDALARALARVGDTIPTLPGGPRVLLACAPSEEHTLGLSLAELCTREAGAHPIWLGRYTPVDELLGELAAPTVRVMVIAASAASADADALRVVAGTLGEACQAAGVSLVLGGAGAWPETPPHTTRVHSFRAYRDELLRALARPTEGAL